MKVVLRRLFPLFKWLLKTFYKWGISISVGALSYWILAPIAYAERGYMAYGGECVASIAIALLVGWAISLKPHKRKYGE